MKKFKAKDGTDFDVEPEFGPLEEADGMTDKERAAVRQRNRTLTNISNALAGVNIRALLPDVPLNAIGITQWHPDTCDCVVQYITDKRSQNAEPVLLRAVSTCLAHEGASALLTSVLTENRKKNKLLEVAAAQLDVPMDQVAWEMNPQTRAVALRHAGFAALPKHKKDAILVVAPDTRIE